VISAPNMAVTLALLALGLAPRADAAERPLVITHANVVDVVNGTIRRDLTIEIRDGKIAGVRDAKAPLPKEATVLDAAGKFLIPGLWDMHVHVQGPQRDLSLLVANGVLGVRDMGSAAKDIFPWREQVARGTLLGPRIIACGPIIDGPTPTNPPVSVSVHDAAGARATARSIKAMGADCLKVHDGVPLDAYLAIADEAKKLELPLVGHVPVRVPTLQASDAGQRSIEHQIGLRGASTAEAAVMEAESKDDVFGEAMRTKNFALIPESIAKKGDLLLDQLDPERAQALFRALARNGTALTPTLVTGQSLTFIDDLAAREDPRDRYVPASERKWWRPEAGMLTRYRTPAYKAFRKREFAKLFEQIPVAHRAGVLFLAGTDTHIPYTYSGFSLHEELQLFVKAGLTPLDALRTATINPVKLLGLEAQLGGIEAGKTASLVLLDADPLQDISNTQKISAVVVAGKLLRSSDLARLLRDAAQSAQ
jgi:hypothetical protein